MYSPLKNREGIKETRPIKLWQRLLRLLLATGKKNWPMRALPPVTIPESIRETHFGSSPLIISKVASS